MICMEAGAEEKYAFQSQQLILSHRLKYTPAGIANGGSQGALLPSIFEVRYSKISFSKFRKPKSIEKTVCKRAVHGKKAAYRKLERLAKIGIFL